MRIAAPYVEFVTPVDREATLALIEKAGRTCYKSEASITPDSAAKFVRQLIKSGHESVLEHASVTVRFVCDRGVSHELVRHRIASFSQESTRYCDYSKDSKGGEVAFIMPSAILGDEGALAVWKDACRAAETAYKTLLRLGCKPETARSVLPTSLKTEVVMTANLREWRHFLKLRSVGEHGKPHPDMRLLADKLLEKLFWALPEVFSDMIDERFKRMEERVNGCAMIERRPPNSGGLAVFTCGDARARNI